MATVHGTLSEFKPGKEGGLEHLQRTLDDDDVKRSILLAACGSPTLRLIKSLTEVDLKTLPYVDLIHYTYSL